MKPIFVIPIWIGLIVCLTWLGARIIRHVHSDGFNAGRADIIRQLHNCISSNDTQWVVNGKYMYERLPGNMEYVSREYTNRFLTNWVLRVRGNR